MGFGQVLCLEIATKDISKGSANSDSNHPERQ